MSLPSLHVQLLGGFLLTPEIEGITSSLRLQALLAHMMLRYPSPVSRAQLAYAFFPDATDEQARTYVRKLLGQLREAWPAVDSALALGSPVLSWLPEFVITSDINDFEAAYSKQDWETAVGFYRGDVLPACMDEWIIPERERLRQHYFEAIERLIAQREREQNFADALQHARLLCRLEPLAEPAHCLVMRYCALTGDRAGIARAYRDCEQTLKRELHIAPSAATRSAYSRYLAVDLTRQFNLPAQPTSFFGRLRELSDIETLIKEGTRLITLLGPGGMGKTRLALEVAARQARQFLHGVHFANLAAVRSRADLCNEVIRALGLVAEVKEARSSPEPALLSYLQDKQILLILDNAEVLTLQEGALAPMSVQFVSELLQAAPELTMVVTSRVALKSRWERLFEVPSLDAMDGVALFSDVARRVRPTFTVEHEDPVALQHILQLTQGWPLALEMAAVGAATQTCLEIAAALKRSVDALAAEWHDVPERQRSVRATFDYSWQLLSRQEQQIFCDLCVCRSGFDENAALSIAGAMTTQVKKPKRFARALADAPSSDLRPTVRRVLVTLREKSFIKSSTQNRYEIHESLRQFGESLLDARPTEAKATRRRHADYFCEMLFQSDQPYRQKNWIHMREFAREDFDNVAAAWRYAIATKNYSLLDKAAAGLVGYTVKSNRFNDGEQLFTEAITVTEQVRAISWKTMAIKAKFPFVKASLQIYSGKIEEAEPVCRSMLAMARIVGSMDGLNYSLDDLGRIAALKGEYAEARDYFIECLVLRRKHYGPALVAMTLSYLGNVYLNLDTPNDLAAAQRCFDEARQHAEKMQDQFQLGFAKLNLGRLALRLNEPQIAAQHFQGVFEVYANYESRPHMEMSRAHEGLSDVANSLGDFAAQREHLTQALLMYAALRLPNLVGVMTQKLALLPD